MPRQLTNCKRAFRLVHRSGGDGAAEVTNEARVVQIDHPDDLTTTHIPVASYNVGPYYFLMAIPRGQLVTEAEQAWWVSKDNEWLRRESFSTLEEAMRYAARPSRNTSK